MLTVLVIGGGLAGCATALEVAERGRTVVIVEKTDALGGKVRRYGCKASPQCRQCGVCHAGGLWEQTERHLRIRIAFETRVGDILGQSGNFSVLLRSKAGMERIDGVSDIVTAIGFEDPDRVPGPGLELKGHPKVFGGYALEQLLAERTAGQIFDAPPESIAFIQCYGSRDLQEKAGYCSRVCCGYATRAARVLRQVYPKAAIVFFYMDLQAVESGPYQQRLMEEGIEFILSRPVSIETGTPHRIRYEQRGHDMLTERAFDAIILSEGIHPAADGDRIAELCGLQQDQYGFLGKLRGVSPEGIHPAGCCSGPKTIKEVCLDAMEIGARIGGGL